MVGQMQVQRLRRILQSPPDVIWRKTQRHIGRKAKNMFFRQRARWLDTQITNRGFVQALTADLPTTGAFLRQLATRQTPHFFWTTSDQPALVAAVRALCPASEAPLIAAADAVCQHTFDLLGSGPTNLGERIDWHTDFKSGHRWDPRQYYTDVRAAAYPGGYDLKLPWELSRCQHFAWLGQAYWFTNNEQYPQAFVAQVTDWIAQNPPALGVNWGCTMDVALRAVNWLWGYAYCQASPTLTDSFRLAFFKSLLAHGRHIMDNLEFSETLTSNHYLSDIVGLVYLGILLPEFKEAQRWREFGLQELEREMFKQVYVDGVDFEASISYHRLATELFLSPTLLAQRNGHQFSPAYLQRLERMLEFVLAVTKPDGRAPLIGDNDNGRVHRLKVWAEPTQEWLDYRYLLAIGAVLFDRPDFAQSAGDQWEEAIWFFGERALDYRQQAEANLADGALLRSTDFPAGGIYIMRQGDGYMVVDAGSNGQKGNGGHAHNDTFSLELFAYGQAWIVDPGAYLYTADYAARNLFRSTMYHNTVQVDERELHPLDKTVLFRLTTDTQPIIHAWETTAAYDFLDVRHAAYARLAQPVTHRRQFFFAKKQQVWIVRDQLTGVGAHQLDWYWHYAPGVTLTLAENKVLACAPGGQRLYLTLLESDAVSGVIEDGWVSAGYGQRTPAQFVRFTKASVALPLTLTTAFFPTPEAVVGEPAIVQSVYQQFLATHGAET